MKITFEKTGQKDAELIYQIDNQAFGDKDHLTPCKDKQELLEYLKGSTVVLIKDGDKPIGFFSYKIKKKESEFTGLAILPKYQRKGVGSKVAKEVLKTLGSSKKIKALTHPQNKPMIKILWKFGFEITDWLPKSFDNKPRLILYKEN